jgi:hypothetical protein
VHLHLEVLAARSNIALSGRCPRAELEVFVAKKLRGAPHCVDAHEGIVTASFRVGSATYRTSYASAFDYLPSVFASTHPIQVSLGHRVMYVTLPGDRVMRLAIESHSRL